MFGVGRHLLCHDFSPVLIARNEDHMLGVAVVDGFLSQLKQTCARLRKFGPRFVPHPLMVCTLADVSCCPVKRLSCTIVRAVLIQIASAVDGWKNLDPRGDDLNVSFAAEFLCQPGPLRGTEHVAGGSFTGTVVAKRWGAVVPCVKIDLVDTVATSRFGKHVRSVDAFALDGPVARVAWVCRRDVEMRHEFVL